MSFQDVDRSVLKVRAVCQQDAFQEEGEKNKCICLYGQLCSFLTHCASFKFINQHCETSKEKLEPDIKRSVTVSAVSYCTTSTSFITFFIMYNCQAEVELVPTGCRPKPGANALTAMIDKSISAGMCLKRRPSESLSFTLRGSGKLRCSVIIKTIDAVHKTNDHSAQSVFKSFILQPQFRVYFCTAKCVKLAGSAPCRTGWRVFFSFREREKKQLTVTFGWTKCSSSADNAASCLNLNKTLLFALHSPRIR